MLLLRPFSNLFLAPGNENLRVFPKKKDTGITKKLLDLNLFTEIYMLSVYSWA